MRRSRDEPLLKSLRARDNWYIRPAAKWNKASAIRFLLDRARGCLPVLVCVGEGWIDEDLVDLPADTLAIKVGRRIEIRSHDQLDKCDLTPCLEKWSDARGISSVIVPFARVR